MKRVVIYLLAIVAFVACAHSEAGFICGNTSSYRTLNVGFEADDTRIHLDQVGKSVWDEHDLLSVFYNSEENQQWQFQGATGDRTGVIAPLSATDAPVVSGDIVVVYPYDADNRYNSQDGTLEATVAEEQHYAEASYGTNGNILVAQGTDDNLSLKNVYGWLKISLTGNMHTIKSIRLTGNNNEQLAGNVVINPQDATAHFVDADAPIMSLLLNCGSGVALNTTMPTAFYIGIIPQTFERGITIEIENSNGEKMTKSTSKSVTISRRTIQPMSPFKFVIEGEPITGTWQLTEWRGTTPSFDVYMSIAEDDTLILWQRMQSREWELYYSDICYEDGTISGVYSDGVAWSASYSVTVDANTMTWIDTADATDVSVYTRCELPEELPSEESETTRAVATERFL